MRPTGATRGRTRALLRRERTMNLGRGRKGWGEGREGGRGGEG